MCGRTSAFPIVLLAVVLGACGDRTVLLDVDPRALPEVVVTRPVGNPPVEGTVEIAPRPGARRGTWDFEVDLGDDGSVEGSGTLEAAAHVPFSFTTPGLHPIVVVLTRPGRRARVERSVNVLDPGRVEVVATARVEPPAGSAGPFAFEGIAVERAGDAVYAGAAGTVFRLDAATLAAVDALVAPGAAGELRGFAVAPDEPLLHVVTATAGVWLVDLDRFETAELFEGLVTGGRYVEALPGRRLYVGGEGALALLDVARGNVLGELTTGAEERVEHFAHSPSGERVAAIVLDTSGGGFRRRVVVADAGLVELARTGLTDRLLEHVAWSPTGERIYVRYGEDRVREPGTELERCGVLVLEAAALEVVEDAVLGVEGRCSTRDRSGGRANPVASTPDGRFLVLPSPGGAFVFDTGLDRPVARTGGEHCCDVAAAPDGDVFYVTGAGGSVAKLRIVR